MLHALCVVKINEVGFIWSKYLCEQMAAEFFRAQARSISKQAASQLPVFFSF